MCPSPMFCKFSSSEQNILDGLHVLSKPTNLFNVCFRHVEAAIQKWLNNILVIMSMERSDIVIKDGGRGNSLFHAIFVTFCHVISVLMKNFDLETWNRSLLHINPKKIGTSQFHEVYLFVHHHDTNEFLISMKRNILACLKKRQCLFTA